MRFIKSILILIILVSCQNKENKKAENSKMIFGTKSLKVQPIIDLSEKLESEDEIISISVDKNGINTLIIHSAPQYRTENGMFAVIKSDKPKDFNILVAAGKQEQTFNNSGICISFILCKDTSALC